MNQDALEPIRSVPFTIRQLQMFVAVAEAGTISRAATRMYVSETAVSLAIGQLEQILGTKLLERRRAHGVTLTSAGEDTLRATRKVLADAAELHENATGQGALTGTVAVGCFLTLGPTLMPGILERFGSEHPGATLSFREGLPGQLHEDLERGITDLIFTYDLRLPPKLARKWLYTLRPGVLLEAGHPAAQQSGPIELSELADEPFILLDNEISEAHQRDIFRSAGIEPDIAFRFQNFETVRAFVGRGFGWSINLTRPVSTITYEGREIVWREIADPNAHVDISAVWPPDRPLSRTARALIDIATELTAHE